MKSSVETCCIVCQLVFCCGKCRWNHEKTTHGLVYDCPICRGLKYLCQPKELNKDFIRHITEEHLPLHCGKCNKYFYTMEDLVNIDECTSISELINKEESERTQSEGVEDKFDSLYEKVIKNNEGENFEGIISVNKSSKTAIITPIVRKKYLVDYESSDSENEISKTEGVRTPHPKLVSKSPKLKRQRAATPHVKKLLSLMRQKVVEEYEETVDEGNFDNSPVSKTTPSRNDNDAELAKEITTPTSHLPHMVKLAQAVSTSTPTHSASSGWSLFPEPGADSPLSEIENTGSPAQSIGNEPSNTESEAVPPKLKSIIVTGSRLRLGSQDSAEKHVTFQDSANTDSSIKTKKVKFAEDTVFKQQANFKRVYRKPKRMLTPGPQRPRFCFNPRFQALINRFENQGLTMARTPIANREKSQENTPPIGEHSNMPARAINFKEESPIIDNNYSKESNELYKTCSDSPETGMSNAITALTANIAGSLQNCLTSIIRTSEEETEIQFKFTITKKKVRVKRIVEDGEGIDEKTSEVDRKVDANKENIWSSVARAVKNVFWGDQSNSATPYRSQDSFNSTSSSGSKRKCEEMMDPDLSPLNHKRHKYEGRIRGRPPLRRSKTWVSSLRSSQSAEHSSLMKGVLSPDDAMNLSF